MNGSENYSTFTLWNTTQQRERRSRQNIPRDMDIKNNLTIARGEGAGDSREKGFQALL